MAYILQSHLLISYPRPYIQNCALTNADWASNETDRKSISCYCFYHLGALVSCFAQKQKVVAASSTKAEYYSLSYAPCKGIWMHLFLASLEFLFPAPFPILCDNQSALKLANMDTSSSCLKHINMHYHFIHEKVVDDTFKTSWITTANMTTNIFTKHLPFPLFSRDCASLGVTPIP